MLLKDIGSNITKFLSTEIPAKMTGTSGSFKD